MPIVIFVNVCYRIELILTSLFNKYVLINYESLPECKLKKNCKLILVFFVEICYIIGNQSDWLYEL